MSKEIVYINTIEELIRKFSIGYIINPELHANDVFIDQVEKCLKETFHQSTMKGIKKFMIKKDTCVTALVMVYETKTENPKNCIRC